MDQTLANPPSNPTDRPAASVRPYLGVERSLTGRRWTDRLGVGNSASALAIAQKLGIPDVVARVLAGRGVAAVDAAAFLDPTLRVLMPDPDTLTDMQAAASRLSDAVMNSEAIAVFGDYDVDGASSAALMARFLRAQGLNPVIYIPDRLFEGYGPNSDAIRQLAAGGTRLVVTVDCGTTSHDALEEARRLGVDVIVIDHHLTGDMNPPAVAVVNPKRPDDLSGLDHLAAVGLVFMTLVAANRELRRRGAYLARPEPDLRIWLDLVALGTVCDCVPLTGLNRAFVVKGLAILTQGTNPGLLALRDVARISGPVSVANLGFALGPRINAGGRIGNASLGARLLASEDAGEVAGIAAELERLNSLRREIESRQVEEAVAEVEASVGAGGALPSVVVAANSGWHPGIVGLIAARLRERFGRPAFAIALGVDGRGVGSGRSVEGVDLGGAVRRALQASLLVKGGGHAMAAGVTVEGARLGEFKAFMADYVAAGTTLSAIPDEIQIDAALTAGGVSAELIGLIERAGPFGTAHAEPIFAFPAHRIAFAETVGERHVRVSLAGGDGTVLKAMAFRATGTPLGDALLANRGMPLHVAGTLSIDQWQNRRQPTLKVLDAAEPRR